MKIFRAIVLSVLAAVLLVSPPAAAAKKKAGHPSYKVKPYKAKIKPVAKHHWYSRTKGQTAGKH